MTKTTTKSDLARGESTRHRSSVLVISTGCPSSIGPELSVRAAARWKGGPCLLVGDEPTLLDAADLVGVPRRRLAPAESLRADTRRGVFIQNAGPRLAPRDRRPGRPGKQAGVAQLAYIEEAVRLRERFQAALVTLAVSKAAIAGSGLPRARSFLGHTEWLQALARRERVTMCFWTPGFSTALVTTHLPLARVPREIDPDKVQTAIVHLAELLSRVGVARPRIAVASLNPHAGELGLIGGEEASAIVPGIRRARRRLSRTGAELCLIGAETAYRLARHGIYDGVVAMYHDQATIPTKLVAFGEAVNVTMGLGYVRTSVDHGTGYDIAWQGVADPAGLAAAMALAERLSRASGTR